jgi:hypothetical protein
MLQVNLAMLAGINRRIAADPAAAIRVAMAQAASVMAGAGAGAAGSGCFGGGGGKSGSSGGGGGGGRIFYSHEGPRSSRQRQRRGSKQHGQGFNNSRGY